MARFDMREYAVRGAETRLSELDAEAAEILRQFPELRGNQSSRGRRGSRGLNGAAKSAGTRSGARKRRAMSPAQRKAVSARMKKYWAERRKAKAAAK